MNYTNREVVRRLKQYDMFLESLNLTTDNIKKERICDQLDKIEKQILLDTNNEYEEEYMELSSKESKLLDEEKDRLRDLITLVTNRREYLDRRKEKHKEVTGSLVELTTFLGEDKLSFYKKKLKTIEKYEENKLTKEKLISEMKTLDIKISEASRNVKANMRLNDMLESKMINLVSKSLEKLNLYELVNSKEDILNKYTSLSYAKDMAVDNLNSVNELDNAELKIECEKMLSEITKEYRVYEEKVNIINLIEIYDKPTSGYEELLNKREKINDILKFLVGSPLHELLNDELSKGYNTIKLEKQDIKNYDELRLEREKKNKRLYEIDEENNSKEFKELLEDLIRSENRYKEERIKLARTKESKEREKKQIEAQRIESSRVQRQKLIEEARLKEQLSNAEKLKEQQKKTVINKEKEELFEKVTKSLEDTQPFVEEKIKNPLENKSLEEMLNRDTFNTLELFENTKIVPNKVKQNNEDSLFKEATLKHEEKVELPVWDEMPSNEDTSSLFKEITPPLVSLEVQEETNTPDIKEDIREEKLPNIPTDNDAEDKIIPKRDNSIYDILENNQNIIWKTTESKKTLNEVPVIENKNRTNKESKEGEVLWKETI